MSVSDIYRAQFDEALKGARLDQIDSQINPDEFPNEIFQNVDMGIRVVQPDARWFDGETMVLADQIDAWFASKEMAYCQPAGLPEALFFCSRHDLNYQFFNWDTVVAWGSRSKTKRLMPSFRRRAGRCGELYMAYHPDWHADKRDRFGDDIAFLVRAKRR